MGFFNRRRDAPAAPRTPRHHHSSSQPFYSMGTRPTFGQWLKWTWLDIITMAAMGAVGLGVCLSPNYDILTKTNMA